MHKTVLLSLSAAALLAAPALAQTSGGSMSSSSMSSMGKSAHSMQSNPSMHAMPATVTSVDAKTGMVEVTSEGMALKLHFPAATLTKLKSGDKITVHMGFTKP